MKFKKDNKEFKTLDEQIEILKFKGLTIEDEEYAKHVLLSENYFFLNGYRHLFLKSEQDKKFIEGTTFEELYSLFLFDRQLRNLLFKNLLIIENNLKSIISYQLSKEYGYKEKEYLKASTFTDDPYKQRQVNDLIHKMKRQIRINGNNHSATFHYINNYGYIPLWVLVKLLSFGIVCEMFSILKRDDQLVIANMYDTPIEKFLEYLPMLANYRNVCAHEDILFENKTQKKIDPTIYHNLLHIDKVDDEYKYGINDVFALVIILKQFLSEENFKDFCEELDGFLDNLEYNLSSITIVKVLDRMGFPENWKEIETYKREKHEN